MTLFLHKFERWLKHENKLLSYKAIVMFFFCFASDENPKTYQPAREKKQTGNLNKNNTDLVNQLK